MIASPVRLVGVLCVLAGIVWLMLTGCSGMGNSEGTVPTPTPTPTPGELVNQIAQATRASSSFSFTISFMGTPVLADPSGMLAITAVDGHIQRPDNAQALVRARSIVSVVELRLISLAGQQYVTNPMTGQWQCLARGTFFDPVELFDPASGIEQFLRDEAANFTLVGIEELDGHQHYHLRGTVTGTQLREISHGLLGLGILQADLWADVQTHRLTRLVLVDTGTSLDNPSIWTLQFSHYDEPVDIQAPLQCP